MVNGVILESKKFKILFFFFVKFVKEGLRFGGSFELLALSLIAYYSGTDGGRNAQCNRWLKKWML